MFEKEIEKEVKKFVCLDKDNVCCRFSSDDEKYYDYNVFKSDIEEKINEINKNNEYYVAFIVGEKWNGDAYVKKAAYNLGMFFESLYCYLFSQEYVIYMNGVIEFKGIHKHGTQIITLVPINRFDDYVIFELSKDLFDSYRCFTNSIINFMKNKISKNNYASNLIFKNYEDNNFNYTELEEELINNNCVMNNIKEFFIDESYKDFIINN